MEYHIRLDEPVAAAVKRIALKQIELAISEAYDESMDRHDAVHRIRKRCKKLRALMRLVRSSLTDTFAEENAFYRDLSRELSSLRDAQALLECFDHTIEDYRAKIDPEKFAPVRELLLARRDQQAGNDDQLSAITRRCAEQFRVAADRAARWKIEPDGFAAFAPGIKRTYRRACIAMRQVQQQPTTENLHEWRKRVKYHWYHTRLLKRMSPQLMRPHRQLGEELGSLLGQDHDLAVLRESLMTSQGPPNVGELLDEFLRLAEMRQENLQRQALSIGRQLLAEKPRQLVSRWEQYWQAWRDVPNATAETTRTS